MADQSLIRETACTIVDKLNKGEVTPLDLLDVTSLVAAGDDDIQSYVTRLEARYDEDAELEDDDDADEDWGDELPTGEEIANELERYLRDQRGQQGSD